MKLTLSIRSLSKSLFAGEVDSVKLPGEVGPFEVRRGHAPLITTLSGGEVVYGVAKRVNRLAIKDGMVRVWNNEVSVWLWEQE